MIKRRQILLGSLGAAALLVVGVWGGAVAAESAIAAAVRRRLSFLSLDEQGLRSFARDYIHFEQTYWRSLLSKHSGWYGQSSWYGWKFRIYSLFHRPVDPLKASHDKRSRRERLEEYLATLFLLSSDFFVTGADESRIVRYRSLYDPMRACGNPFARPVLS